MVRGSDNIEGGQGTGGALTQNRAGNPANEAFTGADWANPAHDSAWNMIRQSHPSYLPVLKGYNEQKQQHFPDE